MASLKTVMAFWQVRQTNQSPTGLEQTSQMLMNSWELVEISWEIYIPTLRPTEFSFIPQRPLAYFRKLFPISLTTGASVFPFVL